MRISTNVHSKDMYECMPQHKSNSSTYTEAIEIYNIDDGRQKHKV